LAGLASRCQADCAAEIHAAAAAMMRSFALANDKAAPEYRRGLDCLGIFRIRTAGCRA
jgi:hypothetical protein